MIEKIKWRMLPLMVLVIALFTPKVIFETLRSTETYQTMEDTFSTVRGKVRSYKHFVNEIDMDVFTNNEENANKPDKDFESEELKKGIFDFGDKILLEKRKKKKVEPKNNNTTTNETNHIDNSLQLASGQNVTFVNNITQSGRIIKTQGYRMLDFLQACYMPSNLTVCGVNGPVYYLIDGKIGTPEQDMQSILDINTYETYYTTCNQLTDCKTSKSKNLYSCMYNSYDPNISFSFNYGNTSYLTNFVESRSTKLLKGCWSWDNVTFGSVYSSYENTNMSYFEFGTVNANNDNTYFQSVLGLGLDLLVSQNNFISDKDRNKYYNNYTEKHNLSLLDHLKVYRLVNLRSYSMYVNENGAGKLLLGAIDTSKYQGKLTYFKNMQTKYFPSSLVKMDSKSKFKLYRPYININYLSLDGLTNYKKKSKLFVTYDAVIESTERFIFGPKLIIKSFAKHYKLKNAQSHYYINCSAQGSPLQITFSQGLNITIPWEDLKFKNLDPSTNRKKNQDCVFALNYKSTQDYFVLGQTFLNNVYFYANIDKNMYGIAPVLRGNQKPKIEVIASESAR